MCSPDWLISKLSFAFTVDNDMSRDWLICNFSFAFTVDNHVSQDWLICKLIRNGSVWPTTFLAYLSRRLVGELIVYSWSGVRPASSLVHNFKHKYLCNQWADHNEILSVASLGWGKGCFSS